MSTTDQTRIIDRVAERPAIHPGSLRDVPLRSLGYRFLAGALTSIVAGGTTIVFAPRAGGFLLAFPAILAASLTLIEEEDDSEEAREDARGAVVGGAALALFAAIAALAFGSMNGAVALLLATAGWFGGAFLGYLLFWFK